MGVAGLTHHHQSLGVGIPACNEGIKIEDPQEEAEVRPLGKKHPYPLLYAVLCSI